MMNKFADHIETVSTRLTAVYQAIERGAVGGYRAVETAAVTGFTRFSDKWIAALFAKEGESTAEARARLARKNETAQ